MKKCKRFINPKPQTKNVQPILTHILTVDNETRKFNLCTKSGFRIDNNSDTIIGLILKYFNS